MYTIIRHPSGTGWTFTNGHRSRSYLMRLKPWASALEAMRYLHERGVPWTDITWHVRFERAETIWKPDQETLDTESQPWYTVSNADKNAAL